MDTLKQAAITFSKIKEIEYHIVVSSGRNKPLEKIIINFCDEDLFHILGLQHLSDIDLPKNKKILISEILSGKISDEYISLSEYYDNHELFSYDINSRIEKASHIEDYFDSNLFTVSIYRLQHNNRTYIKADYLITCKRNASDEEYYMFIRQRKENNVFGIVSAFPKNNVSYWGGKRYLMLKQKVKNNIKCELFRHPDYKGDI